MRVYRFMSLKHGLDSLQNKRLRIGRFRELNDPYDCFPRIVNGPGDDPNINESIAKGFSAKFGQALGLVCYCETVSNPVVWSHYADKHRGLAFAFDYNDPSDGLIMVNYGPTRRSIDYRELQESQRNKDKLTMNRIIKHGFTKKANSWKYEREHRQFISLDACTPVGEHYFRPFPFERLSAVILGAKSDLYESDIKRTLASVQYKGPAQVLRAKMHQRRFEILVEA